MVGVNPTSRTPAHIYIGLVPQASPSPTEGSSAMVVTSIHLGKAPDSKWRLLSSVLACVGKTGERWRTGIIKDHG